ncbi:MAG: EcsC family protein, partial [Acidobacteria bacterium]|nr:EcsC family protein [Acidobacteriota bacterium]
GAGAGSALNLMFTRHFQNVAHGHFTVRRLERKYGEAFVRQEYERLK